VYYLDFFEFLLFAGTALVGVTLAAFLVSFSGPASLGTTLATSLTPLATSLLSLTSLAFLGSATTFAFLLEVVS
jgi:hypothetical protein